MSKGTEKSSFFEKLATVIVDKRNLIFFLYACALIFCLFSRNWVSVCNDITEYLPETTETRQGLTLMEEEFTTFGTARVMVSHVTYEIAEELAEQMEQIEGRHLRPPSGAAPSARTQEVTVSRRHRRTSRSISRGLTP